MKLISQKLILYLIFFCISFTATRRMDACECLPLGLKAAMNAPLIVEASLKHAKYYSKNKTYINEAYFIVNRIIKGKYSHEILKIHTAYAGLSPAGIPVILKKGNKYILFLYQKHNSHFSMDTCNPSINLTHFFKYMQSYSKERIRLIKKIMSELKRKYKWISH